MSYYQLPDNARQLIERLRADAHNETGQAGIYARELIAEYDRQSARVAGPSRRSALLAATATGYVSVGPYATSEHIDELVMRGLGAACRDDAEGPATCFEVNQLGRFVARLLREL